jgi:hypothetical protein
MSNQNGSVFGLTFLCPILDDASASPSHDLQIRNYLSTLPTGAGSPFAIAPGTHIARLAVMDDVIYVGSPAIEEHLQSKYLVFETNCDSDVDPYIRGLAAAVPQQLHAIWQHCTGYPGVADPAKLVAYMKACQISTSFFFAAVNNKTVTQTLVALQTQQAVADFIASHQGIPPAELQRKFLSFVATLRKLPAPKPGSDTPLRDIKTGGHNE